MRFSKTSIRLRAKRSWSATSRSAARSPQNSGAPPSSPSRSSATQAAFSSAVLLALDREALELAVDAAQLAHQRVQPRARLLELCEKRLRSSE